MKSLTKREAIIHENAEECRRRKQKSKRKHCSPYTPCNHASISVDSLSNIASSSDPLLHQLHHNSLLFQNRHRTCVIRLAFSIMSSSSSVRTAHSSPTLLPGPGNVSVLLRRLPSGDESFSMPGPARTGFKISGLGVIKLCSCVGGGLGGCGLISSLGYRIISIWIWNVPSGA